MCCLSTIEAEYLAANEGVKVLLWVKRFLQEIELQQEKYVVFCNSRNAMDLRKNSTFNSLFMHVDVMYHWTSQIG